MMTRALAPSGISMQSDRIFADGPAIAQQLPKTHKMPFLPTRRSAIF
jgi:hypothetical protein